MAQAADGQFGLFVLDAFSSDAIPTHLVSREMIDLYLATLEADGILAFHVSNKFLHLEPTLANLAADAGLVCLARDDMNISPAAHAAGKLPSRYVVMARRQEHLGNLNDDPNWVPVVRDPDLKVWTDQYCDLLSLFHPIRGRPLSPAQAVAKP